MTQQSDPKTALVIEDDPIVMNIVTMLLEKAKIAVTPAVDGCEGLELIKKNYRPDLIFLDMHMPRMDGWEFADKLHEICGHTIPIVVMTAEKEAEQRATEVDAEGWLGKPFKMAKFRATVQRFLG